MQYWVTLCLLHIFCKVFIQSIGCTVYCLLINFEKFENFLESWPSAITSTIYSHAGLLKTIKILINNVVIVSSPLQWAVLLNPTPSIITPILKTPRISQLLIVSSRSPRAPVVQPLVWTTAQQPQQQQHHEAGPRSDRAVSPLLCALGGRSASNLLLQSAGSGQGNDGFAEQDPQLSSHGKNHSYWPRTPVLLSDVNHCVLVFWIAENLRGNFANDLHRYSRKCYTLTRWIL